ncbi:MAG: putative DNA-binding domain-containing protein [Dongiaceae bacterium]
MTSLAELQHRFAGAVRGIEGDERRIAELGIVGAGLAPARRLGIYRNHHRISLGEALTRTFAATAATIGAEAFEVLHHDFVAGFPPMAPCLVEYGAAFPDFLAQDRRLAALPYLADLARLDWALHRAQQAVEAEVFTAQHLAGLQETGLAALVLKPHPSFSLLRSSFPLLRIWRLAEGETEEAVSLDEGGCNLLIWRRDGVVTRGEIDDATAHVIAALIAGTSLGEATVSLAPDLLPQFIAGLLLAGTFRAP